MLPCMSCCAPSWFRLSPPYNFLYTRFEKTGHIMVWRMSSVRPSIRPSGCLSVTYFLSRQLLLYYWMEFLQTCLDDCLWCLVVYEGEITHIASFVLELFPFVTFLLQFFVRTTPPSLLDGIYSNLHGSLPLSSSCTLR